MSKKNKAPRCKTVSEKMATSRENDLAKPQARLLYAVCACNYIRLPLTRQHKPSIFVSRFAPSRHFFHTINYQAEPSHLKNKPQMNTD